ncbi:unnamed protein product [Gongylonema pulchrum]|uniref:Ankyrin repeat protein n=1 Tax=Gongylonema pulchrum TaxID=637853 RepID=A0A183DF74_9BILA|nr:unnamed protein product [Gongylonema pulchrum]
MKMLDSCDRWHYRGREVDKSFLYDIVANISDSIDVDKFDYLLRDSRHADIAIPFNQRSLDRIFAWMRVLDVEEQGRRFRRICYAHKVADEINNVGQSRCFLFDRLYNHQSVRAYEYM